MHRLIMNSAAYRQSSAANDAGMLADSGARLLWRFPTRRLEAEPLRDTILAVSGVLAVLAGRCDEATRLRDWPVALAIAQELLTRRPLSEDAHCRVIELHYLSGDRAAALRAAAQAGCLRRQVQHRDSRRRELLPPGRP